MSIHTSWVKLKDVCQTTSGGTPSRDRADFYGGDIPWVKSGELKDGWITDSEEKITQAGFANSSAKKFPAGTLLIALYGATVGKLGILGIEATTNQAVCGISFNKQLDRDFLFYYLLKQRDKLIESRTGGAQPNISQEIIRELEIPILPLPEQHRIADLLARADRLRRLRRYARQLGDTYLQSVFVEMFGEPDKNPKGWEKVNLGDVLDIITYGLTVRPEYIEKGIPLISAREIRSGEVDFSSAPRMSEADFSETYDKGKPQKGDILFSKTGAIGHCAEVISSDTFAISQNVARLGFKKELVLNAYAIHYLRSEYLQAIAAREAKGNAVQDLQLGVMQRFPFYVPPLSEQERFARVVSRYECLRAQQAESERQAEMLFQSLLAQAFGGA